LYPVLVISAAFLSASVASSHCEIPCGIYDDGLRVKQIREHITTIEKSMHRIVLLGKETPPNHNQMIRWVSNKEHHAGEIQHIIAQYFMTQRIKPGMSNYGELLSGLHKMLILSMKCKQTADLSQASSLKSLLGEFELLYFHKGK